MRHAPNSKLATFVALALTGCGGGIDPEAIYEVHPSSAEVEATNNGSAWDVDSSPPDVSAYFTCPGGTEVSTGALESYTPAWTSGACTAKAEDLQQTGVTLRLEDVDVTTNDTITANGAFKFTEEMLTGGEGSFGQLNAMKSIKFTITAR